MNSMNEELDPKTRRNIMITVLIVGGLALFFYLLFVGLRM